MAAVISSASGGHLARTSALVFNFAIPHEDKFGILYVSIRNTGFTKEEYVGKWIMYDQLNQQLDLAVVAKSKHPEDIYELPEQEKFFDQLTDQLRVVASHFHTQAVEAIRAWRALQPGATVSTPDKAAVAAHNGKHAQEAQDDDAPGKTRPPTLQVSTMRVVTAVRQVWQYALLNAAALQRILLQHDRKLSSDRGHRFMEQFRHGKHPEQGSFLYAPHHQELKCILLIHHLQQQAKQGAAATAPSPPATPQAKPQAPLGTARPTMVRPTPEELAVTNSLPQISTVAAAGDATHEALPSNGVQKGVLMRSYLAIFGQMMDNQVMRGTTSAELDPLEHCENCQAHLSAARGAQCGHVLCAKCFKHYTEGMAKLKSSVACPLCKIPGALTHSIQLKATEQLAELRKTLGQSKSKSAHHGHSSMHEEEDPHATVASLRMSAVTSSFSALKGKVKYGGFGDVGDWSGFLCLRLPHDTRSAVAAARKNDRLGRRQPIKAAANVQCRWAGYVFDDNVCGPVLTHGGKGLR